MKKYLLLGLAVGMSSMLLAGSSFAEDKSSGCGLGWQVTQRNSLLSSMVRNSTNAIFSNNTFGMSSGTSGCAKHSIVQNDKQQIHYAEANHDVLMVEMAQGDGEYLRTFANVMGCAPGSYAYFSQMTKTHYSEIYTNESTSSVEVLNNVQQQIQNDPVLALSCSQVTI